MVTVSQITELNRRFGIPGLAEVVAGNGGLPKVSIASPIAAGEMYLHGAQVTSWKPAGAEEVFFLSSQSRWEDGQAIRGGVPICFPWFRAKSDDPHAPAHGFVRTKSWELEAIAQHGNAISVSMFTESDDSTKRWWPADFRLVYRATFGSELRLELELANKGTTTARFQEALHSYHRVGHVQEARLHGLDKVHYLDNTDANREKVQDGDVVISSQTDRAYLTAKPEVVLEDPVLRRRIHIAKENSRTTVVWNPWIEGAKALPDLGDDEWTQMFCVEASNVLDYAVEVAPGKQHRLAATIRVPGLPDS
ncbi:MAG: D-hexose-6-phosphate mutarotase [Candidatus Korobacteraceae bacterium]